MTRGKTTAPAHPASSEAAADLPAEAHLDSPAALTIVGIGAAAGGLDAFEQFFRACPADTGMAFVLVSHLDPGHQSLMAEIVQRSCAMPVVEALDEIEVVANCVYVIPPNREMIIRHGMLQLSLPTAARGQRMPVDAFLRSLAEDQGELAVAIILSGTATDGTLGLRAILGAGGVCLVQEPATASFDGMPRSAIAAGYVSHVLAIEQMPAMLKKCARASPGRSPGTAGGAGVAAGSGLNQILLQVRHATGHDFSLYKTSTITRRVERRMAQHGIDAMADYARYLKENPAEAPTLVKDLLINVTSFFRDPQAFDLLGQSILPRLLADKPPGDVVRVWVAGCASGEEAYSIAIVLHEFLETLATSPPFRIQIYATDLDDDAIAVARAGRYPPNIAQDITPERLSRFFVKDEGYQIRAFIRETVVFAAHNVIKDPPFARLDLLSCRNLLIYLQPELQDRVIQAFHYALKPDGVLLLSTSESIANHAELFSSLDRPWKFFRARHGVPGGPRSSPGASGRLSAAPGRMATAIDVAELSKLALASSPAAAAVTTDAQGNILYVQGDSGRYLRPAPGLATINVLQMAHDGLSRELRRALLKATGSGVPTLGCEVPVNSGGYSLVSFSVQRLPGQADSVPAGEQLLLVSFDDVVERQPASAAAMKSASAGARRKRAAPGDEAQRLAALENELASARDGLHALIEASQAASEEYQSTNEELQSTNEELQSSNEELQTSREELQSLNEEVFTTNAELSSKIEQLSHSRNDMKNLLDNIDTGVLFVDHQLTIRRYTREAVKIYRLIDSDVGRPLSDIRSNFDGDDLHVDLQAVLDTLVPRVREVRTSDGAWYLVRIQPYRTTDNFIAGVVLSFTEVSDLKSAVAKLKDSGERLDLALSSGEIGLWDWDLGSGSLSFNARRYQMLGYQPGEIKADVESWKAMVHPDDWPLINAALAPHLKGESPAYESEHRLRHRDGHWVWVLDRGKVVARGDDGTPLRALGTHTDISRRKQAEAEVATQRLMLEELLAERTQALATLAQELRAPLTAIVDLARGLVDSDATAEQSERLAQIDGAVSRILAVGNELVEPGR